jgi:hypothetical protein
VTYGFLLGVAILMWGLLAVLAWKLRTMPTIAHDLTVTASLSAGGVIAYTLLTAAITLGPGYPPQALALLAVVAVGIVASIAYVALTKPRSWTRPAHGQPQFANETAAADPQPVRRDPSRYRVKSAAEAMAEAQGGGGVRSARVRRIMDIEV